MTKEIVVLCIGSNQISGDSVGPMVGELLKDSNIKAYVYGTMDRPVNAKNLPEYKKMLDANHKDATVIVVDATVGEEENVGEVRVTKNGVKPGGALNKELPRVGDIGILGVVAKRGKNLLNVLMRVDALLVRKLARKIAGVLVNTVGCAEFTN